MGNEETARTNLETVEAFRQAHGYSFVMENQLMYASAAAYNMTLSVSGGYSDGAFDATFTAGAENNRAAMYDGDYQTSTGAKISLGEALSDLDIAVDADVWHRDGSDIYVGLNRAARLYSAGGEQEGTHLTRMNLPAMISSHEAGATIQFAEGGMMECAVSGAASTASAGWSARTTENGETIFTCYDAAPRTLNITFGEE